jgi:TetR/AcrR family transcriptional repressor of bet genes
MARLNIREHRRNELIDAAIVSIAELGLTDTTLATIAAEAGVSPALVNHYFDGKEALLEATLRRLTKDLAQTIRRLTPPQPTPMQRLDAIIDGCLTSEHLVPGAMLAWQAFWSQIPTNPKLASLQRTINRRFQSNIRFALRKLIHEEAVEEVHFGLFAMIDGFWIRHVIDAGSFKLDSARMICRNYVGLNIQKYSLAPAPRRGGKR